MQLRSLLASILLGATLMSGCKPSYEKPLLSEEISLQMSIPETVCLVREIASDLSLSFHYGTFTDDRGGHASFRLIGESFEIIMVDSGRPANFLVQLYSSSLHNDQTQAATITFLSFVRGLDEGRHDRCI